MSFLRKTMSFVTQQPLAQQEAAPSSFTSTTSTATPPVETPRRMSYLGHSNMTTRNVVIPAEDMRIDTTVLGSGRLGSVFSGYWLEQPVAIKRILPSSEETHNPGTRQRLEEEICALMPHLSQPNILPLYGVCEQADGSLWLVLKRGKKGSLKTVMKEYRGKGMPLGDIFHIGKGILAALAYLHSHGIVYRDLRPGNVLISGDGNAMLDPEFGVIRRVLQVITSQERLTAARTVSGSFVSDSAYMAPENFASGSSSNTSSSNADHNNSSSSSSSSVSAHHNNNNNSSLHRHLTAITADPAISDDMMASSDPFSCSRDIFSFGMVLYEMTTGRAPFPSLRDMQIFASLSKGERPVIHSSLHPGFASIIQSCWAHDPAQRPSPREVLRSFVDLSKELLGGEHTGASLSSSSKTTASATSGTALVGIVEEVEGNSGSGSGGGGNQGAGGGAATTGGGGVTSIRPHIRDVFAAAPSTSQ